MLFKYIWSVTNFFSLYEYLYAYTHTHVAICVQIVQLNVSFAFKWTLVTIQPIIVIRLYDKYHDKYNEYSNADY